MDLSPLFNLMVEREASDLFLTIDSPVRLKVKGTLESVADRKVNAEEIDDIIRHILSDDDYNKFKTDNDLDSSYEIENVGRFRISFFNQKGSPGIVVRRITTEIPTLEDLKLPPVLGDLAMLKNGLILVVGGTGSGKSTTLAAMLNHRNSNEGGHILTIEDPIEYVHPHKMSIVNQREVGTDSKTYHSALRAALRQAPNVLLVGEIRDRETMEAAIGFAETGHLVMSTLHANSASQTLERIMSFFPNDMHEMLNLQISQNLRAVLAQRLIKTRDGESRVAALELMTNTSRIADLILKGEYHGIKTAMKLSEDEGMITFDTTFYNLYKAKKIDYDSAITNADSPTDLRLRIRSEMGDDMPSTLELEDDITDMPVEHDDDSIDDLEL